MANANVAWGLDIGASELKAVKLERVGDSDVRIADFMTIPHKRVLTTPGIDPTESLRVTLGAFVSRVGGELRETPIGIGVPGHSSFARFAKLPPVEAKAVANLVKFEAMQQIPFPIEQVEWDYQAFVSEDQPDIEVGIFAVTRERVDELLSSYTSMGVTPTHITLNPVAAYNAIAYDLSFTEETEGTVIVDVGAQATDLIVAEGGRVWVRTFPLGGHHFTEALAEAFKLDYVKAEKLKRTAETSKYKKQVFQALQPILADLIQDVQRSISYYTETHPGANLARVIGLGSTFKLLGLRKLLSQQLKMEVYRLEEYKRVNVPGPAGADFEAAALNMATAYGLALQPLGLTPLRANLMPMSVIRDAAWARKTPWFIAAAVLGLAAGGVSFLRPVLTEAQIRPVSEERVIAQAVNEARDYIRAYEDMKGANEPPFSIANAQLLLDRRGLYGMLLDDVSQLLANADAALSERFPEGAPGTIDKAYELAGLDVAYVPPGGTLVVGEREAPQAFSRSRRRGGGFPGAGGGGPEPVSAGEFGGLIVTLELDTNHFGAGTDGLPFFNNTILDWLRTNTDRPQRPYVILDNTTGDPSDAGDLVIEQITVEEIFSAADAAMQERGRMPSGRNDQGMRTGGGRAGDGDDLFAAFESEKAQRFGRDGRDQREEQPGNRTADLSRLAPLESAPARFHDGGRDASRYTVRFALQLRDWPSSEGPPEPEPGPSGEQASAGDRSTAGEGGAL